MIVLVMDLMDLFNAVFLLQKNNPLSAKPLLEKTV